MAGYPTDDSLIKLARSLDQSSADSVPKTLARLWTVLSKSISNSFHASEELVLRWLLKNMNGSTEAAEQFRRYPLTWSIISCVFKRIPLISLAKSLADRRFVPILQQTLIEISKPQDEASADVEMLDTGADSKSRKRKRSSDVQSNIENFRSASGCLSTAETLLGALNTLLQKCDLMEENSPSSSRMGAEHVKSLFCSPAKDAAELLRPIFSICDIALREQQEEPLENQDCWIATFSALWNFHLQSNGDAAEVAISFYPTGCIVLAKMDRSKELVLDARVKSRWTRDLRRFFIKNMILPARAAFLNRKDVGLFQMAVDVTNFMSTASCPVLFDLAVRTPYSSDDAVARKDHQDWTQRVFDIVEEPMRNADAAKRNQAVKVVLDTAIDTKASISLSSLRTVCKQYTHTYNKMDLSVVMRVATLDVDAFLISTEGHTLLDDVFTQMNDLSNSDFSGVSDTDHINLIQLLANGFARGRDLVGFLKKWHDSLALCFEKGPGSSCIQNIWSSLINTVSSLLQSSVNTRQLLDLLDWLEAKRTISQPEGLLVVLEAISQGISEEEFVDAVSTRLYDMVSPLKLKAIEDFSRARWWRIIENSIAWLPLDRTNTIWTSVVSDLKKTLKKSDPHSFSAKAAFHCCNRFWLANFRGGEHESDAAELACFYAKKLQSNQDLAPAEGLLKPLMLSESPRIVGFATNVVQLLNMRTASCDIVRNENIVNNSKYFNGLVDHAVALLSREQAENSSWDLADLDVSLQILLELPSETLSREQREQIAPKLLHLITTVRHQELPQPLPLVTKLLSLMMKIMSRPTFYMGMKFADLVAIGDAVVANLLQPGVTAENADISSTYSILHLYEDLASVTFKQMTSNWESRELGYFTEASTTISGWHAKTSTTNVSVHQLILLTSLLRTVELSKVKAQCQKALDAVIVRRLASSLFASDLSSIDTDDVYDDIDWFSTTPQRRLSLIALEHIDAVDPAVIRSHLASKEDLEQLCNVLCERGFRAGWRLKALMFTSYRETIPEPLLISAANTLSISATDASIPLCARADTRDMSNYIDTVLKSINANERDSYVLGICQKIRDDSDIIGLLLTIHRLLREENDPSLRSCLPKLDLAELHSVLANRLVATQNATEFALVAQTICTLLDKKASSMKQWNTELTLSVVSALCSKNSQVTGSIKSSPKTYRWLCRLVEITIKRHRLRLEGHFHLLITTLQALLRHLIVQPSPSASNQTPTIDNNDFSLHESQAKLFSRLLTLVCEPSVASVTRGQPTGQLDSATDAAKRSAGQHMYMVLIAYVRLQLEHAVPRVVREALQPGMYSILDITTQEGRRIINEAVDGSGRAIFKDMYKRYVRFGKWSGI